MHVVAQCDDMAQLRNVCAFKESSIPDLSPVEWGRLVRSDETARTTWLKVEALVTVARSNRIFNAASAWLANSWVRFGDEHVVKKFAEVLLEAFHVC